MIKISIIVPTYNSQEYITRCLASVFDQNLSDQEYEVIIVDDGSSDSTLEVIQQVIRSKQNVKVISQENQRQGAARNNALKVAAGEYIWFVDSDDYIERNSINQLYNKAKNLNLDLICFKNYCIKSNGEKKLASSIRKTNFYNRIFTGKEIIKLRGMFCGPCFCLYKKEYLDKWNIRFREKLLYEDNEFMLRAYFYCKRVLYIEKPFYYVVQTNNSSTRSDSHSPIFDIIKVLNHMIDFVHSIYEEPDTQRDSYYYVVMTFNSAVDKLKSQSKAITERFIREIEPIRLQLIRAMFKSMHFKYWLEGLPFLVSPKLFFQVNKIFK